MSAVPWKNGGSMMKNSTKTPEEQKSAKREHVEREDGIEDAEAERLEAVEGIIDHCRGLYTHHLLSQETRDAYEEQVFTYIREQASVEDAEKNIGWLMQLIDKVESSHTQYVSTLNTAVERGWISASSRARWVARYEDPSLLQMEREHWVSHVFPKYVMRWKQVAEDRESVLRSVDAYALDATDEPEIALLRDRSRFLALGYDRRRELVTRLDALILALSRRKVQDYRAMRDMLRKASGETVSGADAGSLLKEALAAEDPRVHFRSVVVPLLDRREELRRSYDALREDFRSSAVEPEGFRFPGLTQFLRWNEDACGAFLREARNRLDAAQREASDAVRALDAEKKLVRRALDAKDWEGADAALQSLCDSHPGDRELRDLRAFLEAHRQEEESPEMALVLREMHSLVGVVPSSMRGVYRESLKRGSSSFSPFIQHMYLAVWQADRVKERPDAAQDADALPEESRFEEEVPLAFEIGDTAEMQARALDQLETVDVRSEQAEVKGVVAESVTLRHQRFLVNHVNDVLLRHLRRLEGEGMSFAAVA